MSIDDPSDISEIAGWFNSESIIAQAHSFGDMLTWKSEGGSLGSSLDLISKGSGADVTIGEITNNTHDLVSFKAGKYLQTASAFTPLSGPITVFSLHRYNSNSGNPVGWAGMTASNSPSGISAANGKMQINGGSSISSTTNFGSMNRHYGIYNGASSAYIVDTVTVLGDAGTETFDGLTLGADFDGTNQVEMDMQIFGIYNKILSAQELNDLNVWLVLQQIDPANIPASGAGIRGQFFNPVFD